MIKSFSVLLVLFFLLNLSAFEITEKLPAGTKFFAKLDMNLLRENNVYKELQQENKEQINFLSAIFALMSGINLDEIESVYLIARGENDGFILLNGNFDIKRIQQILEINNKNNQIQEESAIFAFEIPDNKAAGKNEEKKNLAAAIDEKTLVFGKPERVKEFLSVLGGKEEPMSLKNTESLKKTFSKKHALQISIIELTDEWYQNPVLANISSMDFSVDLNDGMELNINISMLDTEIAEASEKILSGLAVFLKRIDIEKFSNYKLAKSLKDQILESFKVSSDKNEVFISTGIKKELLLVLIREQIQKNNPLMKKNDNGKNQGKDVFDNTDDENNQIK